MISWICDLHAPSGYGRASRADLRSIIKSGIVPSVMLHQHDKTQMPLDADPFWSQYERKIKQLPADSPDIIVWQETPEFYRPDPTAACVARVEWETSKIIDHNIHGRQDFNWVAQLNRMTEIWPASDFVGNVLKNCGVKTLCVTIPHPVDLEMYTPGEKVIAWNSLNRDRFTALAVFQMTERKNPDALITGWARSSLGKRADCMLLLKTYGASFEDSRMVISAIAKKRASLNIPDLAKNVFPLTDLVEESRMSELYRTADVHICVSRGEGFGLPVQESAACGVPCIYTDATALPEFAVGYPVKWHLEPVSGMPHIPWYAADQDWWSIDVNHFVECLEQAYEDWKNGRLKELGQEARKKIETLHSDERVGSLFKARIKALEGTALIR